VICTPGALDALVPALDEVVADGDGCALELEAGDELARAVALLGGALCAVRLPQPIHALAMIAPSTKPRAKYGVRGVRSLVTTPRR
jgi:hypothetical protein